jgi:hypothetical protein
VSTVSKLRGGQHTPQTGATETHLFWPPLKAFCSSSVSGKAPGSTPGSSLSTTGSTTRRTTLTTPLPTCMLWEALQTICKRPVELLYFSNVCGMNSKNNVNTQRATCMWEVSITRGIVLVVPLLGAAATHLGALYEMHVCVRGCGSTTRRTALTTPLPTCAPGPTRPSRGACKVPQP